MKVNKIVANMFRGENLFATLCMILCLGTVLYSALYRLQNKANRDMLQIYSQTFVDNVEQSGEIKVQDFIILDKTVTAMGGDFSVTLTDANGNRQRLRTLASDLRLDFGTPIVVTTGYDAGATGIALKVCLNEDRRGING